MDTKVPVLLDVKRVNIHRVDLFIEDLFSGTKGHAERAMEKQKVNTKLRVHVCLCVRVWWSKEKGYMRYMRACTPLISFHSVPSPCPLLIGGDIQDSTRLLPHGGYLRIPLEACFPLILSFLC